ncbi:MAG: divalent metal cation transporter [Planctomycetes bacterium]|nr:divalent metal cation transporter [Planctomycetota bacterium]
MALKRKKLLAVIGPGILVAATGVGAGDLATAAFTGIKLGPAILWAVLVGAGLKYIINEGLTRWQLVTGQTLLEGSVRHFGRLILWLFLAYLVFWSFFVAAVLMSACGVTAHAIYPIFAEAANDKILYGIIHSAVAILLIKLGGYRLFAKVMSACIVVMFVVVVATAIALTPSWSEVASGLVTPIIPKFEGEGLPWTVALLGGIGGTVTVMGYGYWIREEGRQSKEDLTTCRIDLAVGYGMTGLFGIAMVIIGSQVRTVAGTGVGLVANIADVLKTELGTIGPTARWAFLAGAWGAVFSSLLGVWQSVPYIFADFWRLMQPKKNDAKKHSVVDTRALPYQIYLFALAIIPAAGLCLINFESIVKWYSIVGALFIPILALALLGLNGHSRWITRQYRNSWLTSLILAAALVFFLLAGWFTFQSKLLS